MSHLDFRQVYNSTYSIVLAEGIIININTSVHEFENN